MEPPPPGPRCPQFSETVLGPISFFWVLQFKSKEQIETKKQAATNGLDSTNGFTAFFIGDVFFGYFEVFKKSMVLYPKVQILSSIHTLREGFFLKADPKTGIGRYAQGNVLYGFYLVVIIEPEKRVQDIFSIQHIEHGRPHRSFYSRGNVKVVHGGGI